MNLQLHRKEPLTDGTKIFRCADDFQLTDFDLHVAQRELNETEEMKIKCIRKLKEMLSEDEHVVYYTDHNFLLSYLRVAKFDCEKAFKAVKKFYAVKKKYPDLFLVSPQLENFLEKNFIRRLPYTNEDGCYIFWVKSGNWNTQEMSFDNMMQLSFSICDITFMNPCLQVNGLMAIYDFKGMTASHVKQILYPSHFLLMLKLLQDIYPSRIKCVIFLNFYSWLHAVYRVFRPFLKQKISKRIIILGSDVTEMHQYIDPLILPKEYGGCVDEKECNITGLIMDNVHYLKYQRSYDQVTEK